MESRGDRGSCSAARHPVMRPDRRTKEPGKLFSCDVHANFAPATAHGRQRKRNERECQAGGCAMMLNSPLGSQPGILGRRRRAKPGRGSPPPRP